MKNLMGLTILLIVISFSAACSTTMPLEAPLCVPLRPVLQDISVEDQRAMKQASPEGFAKTATNDATLKAHVNVLERTIQAHDEPLGSCD